MKTEMRFVFDTNVLVSSLFFPKSKPREAFVLANKLGRIVHSEETLHELWDVMTRSKFDRFLPLSDRFDFLNGFEQRSVLVEILTSVVLCRDPKDDKFLSLAQSANATAIVSGDQDLLVLKSIFAVPILTPDQFLLDFDR